MSDRRECVLDSNVIIYAAADAAGPAASFIATIDPVVSAVARVEVLGFTRLDAASKVGFERFFGWARVAAVDDRVIDRAVTLRQTRKMALGDAIIAATAIELGLPLATRNVADFRWIGGLEVIDPFAPPALST